MDNMPLDYDEILALEFSGAYFVVALAFYVLLALALWRVFSKAGYPGILALIPIVNLVFLVKVAGLSGWWSLLYLVPVANVVLAIIVALKLGERFGKGAVFSIFFLWLFSVIGYFVIGFGKAQYARNA